MILSHVNCFIQAEIIGFQVLLNCLHPRSMRASWWSSVLQGEAVKILASEQRETYLIHFYLLKDEDSPVCGPCNFILIVLHKLCRFWYCSQIFFLHSL